MRLSPAQGFGVDPPCSLQHIAPFSSILLVRLGLERERTSTISAGFRRPPEPPGPTSCGRQGGGTPSPGPKKGLLAKLGWTWVYEASDQARRVHIVGISFRWSLEGSH